MANGLENLILPPFVALAIGAAMGASAWLMPAADLPQGVRYGVVGALFVLSGLFGAPAIAAFARAGTTINPVRIANASALVTGGIYSVSRNPMYVGLTGLLLALAVALARPWLLLGPLFFVLFVTRFQIIPEERAMQAKFGEASTAYRRRVRRWLCRHKLRLIRLPSYLGRVANCIVNKVRASTGSCTTSRASCQG
ncbi:MAG: isoprenylcysteine carboxylmethyltransferase family protein [Geminicoccaceae bacterium]